MRKLVGMVVGGWMMTGCGELDNVGTPAYAAEGQGGALTETPSVLGTPGDRARRSRCPRDTPAALNPPADATLEASFPASGVQIYVCTANPAGAMAWTLKAPHATLYQGSEPAVIHFAGPSWQALDGSLVTGAKVASAPGPDPKAIPWLLLHATSNGAPGLLATVTTIQRLNTVGGAAPATGCDAGHVNAQVLVPYRADYFFYRAVSDGKRVHQCAAE